jgi:NarL family two-component system response regulator LiaR
MAFKMPRIAIIEDQPVMRKRLADYFTGTGRWHVAGTAANLAEARTILSEGVEPGAPAVDILVLDIRLKTGWGLDIIPWLRGLYGEKPPAVAVYSDFNDYANVSAALSLGVRAYVCKNRDETELEAALETLLRGGTYIDPDIEQQLTALVKTASLLTKREAEILVLVKSGLSNREIAARLGISSRTVENILSCVYDKTGIHSRLELQKI